MEDLKLQAAVARLQTLEYESEKPIVVMRRWAPDACPRCERQMNLYWRYQFLRGSEVVLCFSACVRHANVIWPVGE